MKLSKAVQYRNIWLGFAMMVIVLYHSGFHVPHNLFLFVKQIGYGGVDVCLFASGIGCYYSLEKDPHPLKFMKRRVRRLYPTYLCFIIPWLIYKLSAGDFPFPAVLGNLLCVQSFISWGHHFNWYLSCLLVLYLFAPYFKLITDSSKKLSHDAVVLLLMILLSIPFIEISPHLIMVIRMPLFYLGMVYAKHAVSGTSVTAKSWLAHLALCAVGLASLHFFLNHYDNILWSHGLYWYPLILIVPGLCLVLSRLAEIAEQYAFTRWICRMLNTVGIYSFEVYLIHIFLYETVMASVPVPENWIHRDLVWLCTIPVIVAGSFLLNRAAGLLLSVFSRSASHAKG